MVWAARMSGRLQRGGLGLRGGGARGLAQPGGTERLAGWEDLELEGLEFDPHEGPGWGMVCLAHTLTRPCLSPQ